MSHTFNKDALKDKVVKGRHDEVFSALLIDDLHEDLQNQVRLLESRHTALEKSNNQGLISREAYTLERARINNSLLQLIDDIGEELAENTATTADAAPTQPSPSDGAVESSSSSAKPPSSPPPTPPEAPQSGSTNPLHAGVYMAIAITGLLGIGWMLVSGKMAEVSNLEGYTYLWLLGLCVAAFLFGGMSSFAEISGKRKSLELNLGRAFAGALIVVGGFYIAVGNEQPKDDLEPQKPIPVVPIDTLEEEPGNITLPKEKPKEPLPKPKTQPPQPDPIKPTTPPKDPTLLSTNSNEGTSTTAQASIPTPIPYECPTNCKSMEIRYETKHRFVVYHVKNGVQKEIIQNGKYINIEKGEQAIMLKDTNCNQELWCNPCNIIDSTTYIRFSHQYQNIQAK